MVMVLTPGMRVGRQPQPLVAVSLLRSFPDHACQRTGDGVPGNIKAEPSEARVGCWAEGATGQKSWRGGYHARIAAWR